MQGSWKPSRDKSFSSNTIPVANGTLSPRLLGIVIFVTLERSRVSLWTNVVVVCSDELADVMPMKHDAPGAMPKERTVSPKECAIALAVAVMYKSEQ